MSGLSRLWQALGRSGGTSAENSRALQGAVDALGRDMVALRTTIDRLGAQLEAIERQMELVAAVRRQEIDVAPRLAALQHVLDADRAADHIRTAVTRAERRNAPVPHLIVPNMLPADLYSAAIDAIPESIFFDGGAAGQILRLPPRLAPTWLLTTWTFLVDIVDRVIGPLVITRFGPPLHHSAPLTLRSARLVRRQPGAAAPPPPESGTHLMVVLPLVHPDDDDRANTAIAMLEGAGAHAYPSTPPAARPDLVRYACEWRFGPAPETMGGQR